MFVLFWNPQFFIHGWKMIMQKNKNALADSFLSSPRAHHRHCQNVRCGPRALQGAPIENAEPGLLPRPGRAKPPLQPGGPQRNPHYFGSWSSQLCCGSEKRCSLPEHHCFHTPTTYAPSPTWSDSSRSTTALLEPRHNKKYIPFASLWNVAGSRLLGVYDST